MRIILIGFMASGKTTVGKAIANKLGLKFIDMDREIEKEENCSIADIFKEHGEAYFRMAETNLLKNVIYKEDVVISTGGGVVTKEENIDILKTQENVIFLDANVETLVRNVSSEVEKRPLLKESFDVQKKISNMLSSRYDKYIRASKLIIDTNNKNVEEVVGQILVYIG